MNQLSVTDLQWRGFTANPVGLPHFWRTIPSAAGPQQLYIQPWCSWYFPGAPPTACHRNAEPQSLWDLGGRVPQPSHIPHTHHQLCHSRATLPAPQGKSKSRPHNLQKHLAPTSPSEVCTSPVELPRCSPEGSAQGSALQQSQQLRGWQQCQQGPSCCRHSAPTPADLQELTWFYHGNKVTPYRSC